MPWRNGRQFAGDIFKHTFLNENIDILIPIVLRFIPGTLVNNKSTLDQ